MDPYRMYLGLDDSYRPVGRPDEPPMPPAYPLRVKTFIYACALEADEMENLRAGAKKQQRAAMG